MSTRPSGFFFPGRMYWGHTTSPQTILPRTFFISSNENARRVTDRTLPREPTLAASANALSSSGASYSSQRSSGCWQGWTARNAGASNVIVRQGGLPVPRAAPSRAATSSGRPAAAAAAHSTVEVAAARAAPAAVAVVAAGAAVVEAAAAVETAPTGRPGRLPAVLPDHLGPCRRAGPHRRTAAFAAVPYLAGPPGVANAATGSRCR